MLRSNLCCLLCLMTKEYVGQPSTTTTTKHRLTYCSLQTELVRPPETDLQRPEYVKLALLVFSKDQCISAAANEYRMVTSASRLFVEKSHQFSGSSPLPTPRRKRRFVISPGKMPMSRK